MTQTTKAKIVTCPNCGNQYGSLAKHICRYKDIIGCVERDFSGEKAFYIRIPCVDQNELDDLQSKLVKLRAEKKL